MEPEPTAQTTNEPATVACRELTVVNRMGIHARPATKIVELTNTFRSKVTITKDGEAVDAKSIFGVMTLAAIQGTILTVRAEGEDAEELLDALEDLFQTGFDELGNDGGEKGPQETSG
jgi:phosphotransferase system HPr (HPr) family protein